MTSFARVLTLLAVALTGADAFGARAGWVSKAHMSQVADIRMPMPAAAPKTKTRTITKPGVAQPGKPQQQQKTAAVVPKRKTESAYVPMWKVLLLGDEEYEEDPVCGVIVEVLPDLGPEGAREKYHEAQATGDAVLTVVNQEHAEAFVSQFHRSTPMVFADAQPE